MSQDVIKLLIDACIETFYMVSVSSIIATLVGLPLGVLLTVTGRGHILENTVLNQTIGSIVNATRSTPFIILMVAIIPLTRMVVGTSIGTTAAIVPLTISAIPFIARIIESSLREVDGGVIEAAQSMGATPLDIIRKVLLPEAMPSIILGLTLTVVSLIGYSAMVGAVACITAATAGHALAAGPLRGLTVVARPESAARVRSFRGASAFSGNGKRE